VPAICMLDQFDPKSPWHDVRVRLAASHAIDRKAIAQSFNNGVGPRVQESSLGRIPLHYYTAPFEDIRLKAE
jgi:ABC-type transport system substrate-binding protein